MEELGSLMDFGIEEVESLAKLPHEDLKLFLNCTRHIFPTEAKFMAWVRSGLRQGLWNKHPVKMELLNSQRRKIKNPNPNPRKGAELVWGYECACCGNDYRQADVEVDHMVGEFSLKTIDDLVNFFKKLVFVTPADLQIVCKTCHGIKTYSERYGVSMVEAEATKMALETLKENKHNEELKRMGVTKPYPKTKAREVLVNLYMQEIEER